MTTAAPSTALATIQPAFTDAERLARAGFQAGFRGLTRDAYTLDLRQFTSWCRTRSVALLAVRRADIESFARELQARGRARATVTQRLCTIYRRRHRAPGPGARAPDAHAHAQGRQGRHRPAGAAHRPGDRPGHQRTHRRASVPGRRRAAAGPARRRTDRPQGRAPRRDRQNRHAPHAAARVHHRRVRRWGPAARRPRSRLSCRSENHHAPERARGSLDRHATYIVAAYVAGAAR